MSKGGAFKNDFLKLILNGTPIANIADDATASPLTELYVALHTASPGETGDQATNEATYGSYARVAASRTTGGFAVTDHSVSPVSDIDFPKATSGSEIITHFSIGTSPSGAGKILYYGTVTPNIEVSVGRIPRLTTSSTITEDEPAESPAWFDEFTPLAELYVSSTGTGDGTEGDPMSLASAVSGASPGDLYWLNAGTYNVGETHDFTADGTEANPIVYRAIPGAHVIFVGRTQLSGDHNWLWGVEVTNPSGSEPSSRDSAIRINAPGAHVINCIVHHNWVVNGIGAWDVGAGIVVYGNIVYENGENVGTQNPHGIYAQNDFDTNGLKYIVHNILADSEMPGGSGASQFNFHAYTEGGFLTGFWIEGNIVQNGPFLLGGLNVPHQRNTIKGNYFNEVNPRNGFGRPVQIDFIDNYLAKAHLKIQYLWGVPEDTHTKHLPSTITGNTIIADDNAVAAGVRTSSFHATWPGRCEGCPEIDPLDTWDNNEYYRIGGSSVLFEVHIDNGGSLINRTFAEWKTLTSNGGNAFDQSSTLTAPATLDNHVVTIPNDYEAGRGHIVIYNWEGLTSEDVDLSSIVANGADYDIYPYNDVFGTPVASGTYAGGTVALDVTGLEYAVFVVLSQ